MAVRPIYEGDTILLYCQYAKGFVFSLPPSSMYSYVTIYPDSYVTRPNVHLIAFQVLPEYADIDLCSVSPISVLKDEEKTYLHRKLVYGRKIKLLHVASKKYLSLPVVGRTEIDTKPATLDTFNESCLFKMMPSASGKNRGDTVCPGDEIILESVQKKGYHILCVSNPLTKSHELKMAVTKSMFCIHPQTISDASIAPKDIRGGSVVRFHNVDKDSYLGGAGSTVADLLPGELEHDSEVKVYARKKKQLSVPRPPPASGDCWWQLEKTGNALNGSSFTFGEKCHIKHLPTERYLAYSDSNNELMLGTISEITNNSQYKYTFYITSTDSDNGTDTKVCKGSMIRIADSLEENRRYITIDESRWDWMTESARRISSGSKWFGLQLKRQNGVDALNCFLISEVKPDYIHGMYEVESIKYTLVKYFKEISESPDNLPVLDEPLDVLKRLSESLKSNSEAVLCTHAKMLRVTHVVDLLVAFLSLPLKEKSLFTSICDVLAKYAKVKSNRSCSYLAKLSFLDLFFRKHGKGVGVETFLSVLVENQSDIAKVLVERFSYYCSQLSSMSEMNVDAATLNLLSKLCFNNGRPEKSLQDTICSNIVMKEEGTFYWTEKRGNAVYYYKTGKDHEQKPLSDLCSIRMSPEGPEFKFFIAQLELFSRVCKGVNRTSIAMVSKWFPFEEALVVLNNPNLHSLVKSAYLQLVISVYLDEAIESSGIDIYSMWHCYLWEKLIPDPPANTCQPLQGANVMGALIDSLPNYADEIKQLLVVIKDGFVEDHRSLCVTEHHDYLNQMLAALEPMAAYGYCWNVGNAPKLFDVESLVVILDGRDDCIYRDNPGSPENQAYRESGRFEGKPENVPIFRIKARAMNLLRIFFEQFIYLALEQFLYSFSHRRSGHTTVQDFIFPFAPTAILGQGVEHYLNSDNPLQSNLFHKYAEGPLRRHFEFPDYECFDVRKEKGQNLVCILLDLMKYEDAELRYGSASLLFDIYNKEHIMFAQAEVSYIVKGDRTVYDDLAYYGTFNDDDRIFLTLIQGKGDESVGEMLEFLQMAMLVAEDETEVNMCTQNITFTTGMFAALMIYVLKFCPTREIEQSNLLKSSCRLLQIMCRGNEKIQRKVFENFSDFMRVQMCVSSIARLLTETLTNNVSLCHELTECDVALLFTLACKSSESADIAGENAPNPSEYLEFFTTLEAAMKPCKSDGPLLKSHQITVVKSFLNCHTDLFGKLMTEDDDDSTISTRRLEILEKRLNDDTELLTLLHITGVLATTCEGINQFTANVCRDIFSLGELVDILVSADIPSVRKIPFARLLLGAYVSTEMESIASLDHLSKIMEFWNHVYTCTDRIKPFIEEQDDDSVKNFLRKSSAYYLTWNEIFNDEGAADAYFIHYFVEGLGPLLTTFCEELSCYKGNTLMKNEYFRIIKPLTETFQELGTTIVGLLNNKNSILVTNMVQSQFWKKCLNCINSVFSVTAVASLTDTRSRPEDFESPELKDHHKIMSEQIEVNRDFQRFIANYRKIFNWKKKSLSTHHPKEELRGSDGLLPGGPTFLKLIKLFEIPVNEFLVDEHCEADLTDIVCLLRLLECIFQFLGRVLTSRGRARINDTLTSTLQLLFGIVYKRMESINDKTWNEGYTKLIEPIQVSLARAKFTEVCLQLMSHPKDTIITQIFAFLYTLVFNGNETTQDIVCNLIETDPKFFMKIREILATVFLQFDVHIHVHMIPRSSAQIKHMRSTHPFMLQRRHSTGSHHSEAHIPMEGTEHIRLVERTRDEKTPSPPIAADTGGEEVVCVELDASQEDSLWRTGVALDLISALCDGQNRKVQNVMRKQEDSLSNVDVICEVAAIFQTLAEVRALFHCDHESIVTTMIKAIQSLIEMCAGNLANQQVALDGQVIDSINLSLESPCTDIKVTLMQCKAIELLEVLMEETSKESGQVIKAISKDLKKKKVVLFIKEVYKTDYSDEDFHSKRDKIRLSMFKAYHILRSLCDYDKVSFEKFADLSSEDFNMWKEFNDQTHSIEINYITKDKQEILTRVYFPFKSSRTLSDDEKSQLQDGLNRDAPEDKAKDLLEWTDSVWKNDKHKRFLKKYHIYRPLMFMSEPRHWALVILTVLLNVLVLAFFDIPSYSCERDDNSTDNTSGILLFPNPSRCWSGYQPALLYIFGAVHIILAVWMILEYFVKEAPNFIFYIPSMKMKLYKTKVWTKRNARFFSDLCYYTNNKVFYGYFELERPQESQCFDIYFFSTYPMYRIFFVISSILGLSTYGYFYCFCLPYVFIKVDVLQHVVKAVGGKAKQLIFVALLIFVLLLIYAVLSFAVMSSFFALDEQNDLYCRTLFECYVTVVRIGLLDTLGDSLPVTYVGQTGKDFNIYVWRSVIDLSFFAIISIIMLEIITAILVDRFSELRAERDAALKDQRDFCYVCGIPNDTFEREGAKGKGFWEHYHEDHNLYSYIYYGLHVRSMSPRDHNALEKYVYDMMEKKNISFYPLRKAKVLGGAIATETTQLVEKITVAIKKSVGKTDN